MERNKDAVVPIALTVAILAGTAAILFRGERHDINYQDQTDLPTHTPSVAIDLSEVNTNENVVAQIESQDSSELKMLAEATSYLENTPNKYLNNSLLIIRNYENKGHFKMVTSVPEKAFAQGNIKAVDLFFQNSVGGKNTFLVVNTKMVNEQELTSEEVALLIAHEANVYLDFYDAIPKQLQLDPRADLNLGINNKILIEKRKNLENMYWLTMARSVIEPLRNTKQLTSSKFDVLLSGNLSGNLETWLASLPQTSFPQGLSK